MITNEAPLDRPVREEPNGHKTIGSVWIKSATESVAAIGLQIALAPSMRLHRGPESPQEPPHVVVCYADGSGPREAASEVVRVRALAPDAAIVVVGSASDFGLARAVVRAGADGFLHIGMPTRQLARAISVAAEGTSVLPRALLKMALEEKREPDHLSKLRVRQREILELVSEGLSNAQVAKRLYLSESTVKQHLRAAYRVLQVKNRNEASRALRRGDPDKVARRWSMESE